MTWPIVTLTIQAEADIVAVRQRARHIAEILGFERQEQTRIATAVSEIARNAFSYGGGGRAEFLLENDKAPQVFLIRIADRGPGIADLDAVLEGRYRSAQGMGLGLTGARRLMSHFAITSSASGTVVELGQPLPRRAAAVTSSSLAALAASLAQEPPQTPVTLLLQQNRELLQSLEEARRRQEEAEQLNRELGDTNRGVVALTAELDERAEQLRQASETKSRFLSNMSHEFRTPLNSILALSRLLLDRVDGSLNSEQTRQIGYIRQSAESLLELVNDLLDLSKVEAGKIEVRPSNFTVQDLFAALRGALKPLRDDSDVALIFENAADLPELHTDQGKLAQVLRNFISNALKFTRRGEVRVSAHHDAQAGTMTFAVSDTGIGIAPEDQARIFNEFVQLESDHQPAKGTGLGLSLSLGLAELLQGHIWLESEVGQGSTFFVAVPLHYSGRTAEQDARRTATKKILVIDDDEMFRYVIRHIIEQDERYAVQEAINGEQGLEFVARERPDLVVLDLQMPQLDGFEVLSRLRSVYGESLRVVIATSLTLDETIIGRLPADVPVVSKHSLSRDSFLATISDVMIG